MRSEVTSSKTVRLLTSMLSLMSCLLLHQVLCTQSFVKGYKFLWPFGAIQTFIPLTHYSLPVACTDFTSLNPICPSSTVNACETGPAPLLIFLVSSGSTVLPWHVVTVQ